MVRNEKSSDEISVTRGRLGSISVYDVTSDELDILEHGSPNSTYLNFAIALIPTGISFFISIFSTKIEDIKIYNVFWIVALVCTLGGLVLLGVWWKTNKASQSVIQRIKDRIQVQKQLESTKEVEKTLQ